MIYVIAFDFSNALPLVKFIGYAINIEIALVMRWLWYYLMNDLAFKHAIVQAIDYDIGYAI
jgi:hypothetical protein